MAGEPLVEQLTLDIQPALDAIEPLGAALTDLAHGFGTVLGDAISSAVGSPIDSNQLIDAAGITAAIDTAVADAFPPPIPIDADPTLLDAALADALDQPRTVPVDGDTTDLTAALDQVTAAPIAVPVSADTAAAVAAIADISADPIQVPVEADTSEAEAQIADLGGAAASSSEGVNSLTAATDSLQLATELASGEAGAFAEGLNLITPASAEAGAGITAVGLFLGKTISLAADAEAQNKRFTATFGPLAQAIRDNATGGIGGLNLSLDELGQKTATSVTDIQASASKIGELGKSANAAAPLIENTTQKVLALAGTAAVTNPRLGDTAQVTDTLSRLLGVGGQRLANYGIALTRAQIQAEAFRETGKRNVADLTVFDRVTAGATLAAAQFGDTLSLKFAAGSQNAQIQLRGLKVSLEETFAAIGQPLLQPTITFFTELLPIAKSLGEVIGAIGQAILPVLDIIGFALTPIAGLLSLVADGIKAIGPAGIIAAAGIAILGPDLFVAAAGFGSATVTATAFGAALEFATGPIGGTIAVLAAIGFALRTFNAQSDAAKKEAKDFAATLIDTSGNATGIYVAGVKSMTDELAQFLDAQIKAGKENTLREALLTAGTTTDAVANSVSHGSQQWDLYRDTIDKAIVSQKGISLSALKDIDAIDRQRDAVKKLVADQLTNVVATGQLTQKQIDQIVAQNTSKKSGEDYAAVLDQVNAKIEEQTARQAALAKLQPGYAKSVRDTADSIQKGTIVSAEAADIAKQLGLTQADATKFINDLTKATDDLADKQKLASPQARNLAIAFATGKITAAQYETELVGMGVHLGSVTTALSDGQKALDDYTKATQAAKDQTLLLSPAAQELTLELEAGTISASDAEKGFIGLGVSISATQQAVKDAQAEVKNFIETLVKGLQPSQSALSTWSSQIDSDFKKVQGDTGKKVKDLKTDLASLSKDDDPQKFIASLNKQTIDAVKFFDNLSRLVALHAPLLAQEFANAGVSSASALSTLLGSGPAKVKAAEAAQGLFDGAIFATSVKGKELNAKIQEQLHGIDPANLKTQGQEGGAALINGLTAGIEHSTGLTSTAHTGAAVGGIVDKTLGDIKGKAKTAGKEAASGFAEGFKPADSAGKRLDEVPAAIVAHAGPPAQTAKEQGGFTGLAYGVGADFPGAIPPAMAGVAPAIVKANGPNVDVSLNEGKTTGAAFGAGFVLGLTSENPAIAKAAAVAGLTAKTAANAALGIHSPSTVGAQIGKDFTDGIALGIANGTLTLTDASQALAAALASSTGSSLSNLASALPTVSSDISAFGSAITSALSAQASALKDYHKAFEVYGQDKDKERVLVQESAAAAANLVTADAEFRKAQLEFPKKASAADRLALSDKRTAYSNALSEARRFAGQLSAIQKQMVTQQGQIADAAKGLAAANKDVTVASDAETFIKNLNKQTAAGRVFLAEIEKLKREGFSDLAEQLAQSGPDAAGTLASAFSGSKGKARQAEAAIDAANAFAKTYEAQLEKLFGPADGVTAPITKALGVASSGVHITKTTSPVTLTGPIAKNPIDTTPLGRQFGQPVVSGLSGVQLASTLALDLTVVLDSGEKVHAAVTVPVPKGPSLTQQVRAQVHAS